MKQLSLIVSLHDVTLRTLDRVQRQIEELAALDVHQTSLLVVPRYHEQERLDENGEACERLRGFQSAGHEMVLHGWVHQAPAAVDHPCGLRFPGAWFYQNCYTAGEAEFLSLSRDEAAARIQDGLVLLRQAGLAPVGFIAPAWLMNAAACQAAADRQLLYTNTISEIIHLPDGRRHRTRSCVWSTRAGWRRAASLVWNALLFQRLQRVDPLRISLHPGDLEHPAIWRQVKTLIRRARETRRPTTYAAWVRSTLAGEK